MKKLIITGLLIALFSSCYKNELIDTTIMPEATTEGKNTFGCLVDGWLYVGGRYHNVGALIDINEQQSIVFRYFETGDSIAVRVKVGDTQYLKFSIYGITRNVKTCELRNARFDNDYNTTGNGGNTPLDNVGTVEITQFNDSARIVSGIFYGNGSNPRITEGRFDVVYQKK